MDSFLAALILAFLVWIALVAAWLLSRRRRRSHKEPSVLHTTHYLSSSRVKISTLAVSGTARIPLETAKSLEIESGIEGKMYRDGSERVLPAQGFGEKRALSVLISADKSLLPGEMLISEKDARILRLGRGGLLRLKYVDPKPAKVYLYHAYRGKVPILGIPSPKLTLQPFGPHKVVTPSKVEIRSSEETSNDD